MEQRCDLQIDGTPEDIKSVLDFLKIDKTQRSDNQNNLFDLFENEKSEHSICSGYSDKQFDADLDRMYSDPANDSHVFFLSYHKNLFRFVSYLSAKFLSCRFKISWIEKYQGDEHLFVVVVEKACVIYYQHGLSFTVAPNMTQFLKENHLEEYCDLHTRKEREISE